MTDPTTFGTGDREEPLGLLLTGRSCPAAFSDAEARRFELSSRGDRVPGRLLLPRVRSGACPLLVLQGDAGASRDAATLDFARTWLDSGFAIATIDLSLHGERSSPKFSERLVDTISNVRSGDNLDAAPRDSFHENGSALLIEFTRQSVCDLSRTLDGLSTLVEIDGNRIGVLGLGHGASLVAIMASLDPRAKAVALAHCDARSLPKIDPRRFVAAIGPRPILLLENDPGGDREALFDACAEPRLRCPVNGSNGTLSSEAAETAREFFAKQL